MVCYWTVVAASLALTQVLTHALDLASEGIPTSRTVGMGDTPSSCCAWPAEGADGAATLWGAAIADPSGRGANSGGKLPPSLPPVRAGGVRHCSLWGALLLTFRRHCMQRC